MQPALTTGLRRAAAALPRRRRLHRAAAAIGIPADERPESLIKWASTTGSVAMLSSFGTQAAVLLHMATRVVPEIPVIMIDTGYLFEETHDYARQLTETLGLNLVVAKAEPIEAEHGRLWESERDEDHALYGRLTKKLPLARALASLDARPDFMLSGLRASQTAARAGMESVQPQGDGSFKLLPMLRMTDQDVEEYIERYKLPAHPLAAKGYATVGDWHSSRPLLEGEDVRATRFGGRFQECGLHVTDDAEVDAMIGREAMAAFGKSRRELTRQRSFEILSDTKAAESNTCITTHFVKKRMDDGSMCGKCTDVSAKMKADGLEGLVGGVSIAETTDKESDGVALAEHFGQEKAPFFLVKDECAVNPEWKPIYAYGQWKSLMKNAQAA